MIPVTPAIALAEGEIDLRFIRASGPGGQNVNKVATAVELRFDVKGSQSLPEPVRLRLIALAGRRLTQEGVLVLKAQEHRTQEANKAAAVARLVALIRAAAKRAPPRLPTRPTKASLARHRVAKERRGAVKAARGKPGFDD